ncbi:MAG: thiamine diphosphokinase [Chloroflexota bacterium]
MKTIIFLNGDINDLVAAKKFFQPENFVIAVDGGARHCEALSLIPNVIIGDLDSLSDAEVLHWDNKNVEIIRHDPDKNDTDFELALLYAKDQAKDELIVFGASGRRLDQVLANFLLPAYEKLQGLNISFWVDGQTISLIKQAKEIQAPIGTTVSLIPIGGRATGVTTQGLVWPLSDESLAFGATRGVSNQMAVETARIRLKSGFLLCIVGSQD